MQAAIALGQLSNVMGCLSTYGIGSAPPYFAAGYVPQAKWYQLGFIMSIWYLLVWLVAGGAWWKVRGFSKAHVRHCMTHKAWCLPSAVYMYNGAEVLQSAAILPSSLRGCFHCALD